MGAVISHCDRYRYRLDRELGSAEPVLLYVMLNPSTADGQKDDPTIRKCLGFAKRLGYERIRVVNLYAWRATKPERLVDAEDPVGPKNDAFLKDALATASRIVVAWGGISPPRATAVSKAARIRRLLELAGDKSLECLGTCADGSPRHPLMLAYATELQPWEPWGVPSV